MVAYSALATEMDASATRAEPRREIVLALHKEIIIARGICEAYNPKVIVHRVICLRSRTLPKIEKSMA